ncbi:MAG: hypothetical protein AB1632_14050 [Nitrospirota bacterium]
MRRKFYPSLFIAAFSCVLFFAPVCALEQPPTGERELLEKYHKLEPALADSYFGIPLYIESNDGNSSLHGDVYGIINHQFEDIEKVIQMPSNWCNIALVHLNVKTCTYRKLNSAWLLIFYSGRKFYQPPEDAYQLKYVFEIAAKQPGYINISLKADNGPLSTRDHRIMLEAAPLDARRTFIHMSYSYNYGLLAQMAMNGYFSSLGYGKIGFSITGKDSDGKPVYVTGIRGAIERNSVRYYLAVKAYMDTLAFPEQERFKRCINLWYDLTDKFPQQLFELEKEDYIKYKTREYKNQLILQRRADEMPSD